MPLAHRTKLIVQRAAKAADQTPFHVNQPGNGINVHEVMHASGQGHDNYNDQMAARLGELWTAYGNQTAEVARDKLNEYLGKVRQVIVANPNVKINDLVLPPL